MSGRSGTRPILLDLFCKAGGMTKGYQQAGFYVIGVDIEPQPNYCGDEFVQTDAVGLLRDSLLGWRDLWRWRMAAVHASPPCQHYLNLGAVNRAMGRTYEHPDLIAEVRELLIATGLPYVIENGPDARRAMHDPVRICGTGLDLPLRRHRLFESNVPLEGVPCAHDRIHRASLLDRLAPEGRAPLEHRRAGLRQRRWPFRMARRHGHRLDDLGRDDRGRPAGLRRAHRAAAHGARRGGGGMRLIRWVLGFLTMDGDLCPFWRATSSRRGSGVTSRQSGSNGEQS